MTTLILTSPAPAGPAPQVYPGAFLPGMIPDAAAAQYGTPVSRPGGSSVIWGPARAVPAPGVQLDRGGPVEHGRADGS
jgi:hypothetical protein